MATPKALIMTGNGLNCEEETAYAFEKAGAHSEIVHMDDVLSGEKKLEDHQILAFIGGFSFGDHMGAGTVQALKYQHHLKEDISKFMEKGLMIGICNGFQTMTRLGILPGFDQNYFSQKVALSVNDSCRYEDRWINLRLNETPCVFTKGIENMFLPVRHGEGKLYAPKDIIKRLFDDNLVVMQYCDEKNRVTMEYPNNPNGSLEAIAAICDPSGRILGMMPHPEAYVSPYHHPSWTREKGKLPEEGEGLKIFKNAVRYFD